jgi:hypothetical protein
MGRKRAGRCQVIYFWTTWFSGSSHKFVRHRCGWHDRFWLKSNWVKGWREQRPTFLVICQVGEDWIVVQEQQTGLQEEAGWFGEGDGLYISLPKP